MKKSLLVACLLGLIYSVSVAQNAKQKPADGGIKQPAKEAAPKKLTPEEIKKVVAAVSYAYGMNVGRSVKNEGLALNQEMLIKGIQHALNDTKQDISDADLRKAMDKYGPILQRKREELRAEMIKKSKANIAAGEAFFAKNKSAKGVITTKSGLQYKVLKAGKGPTTKFSDIVSVRYKGTLLNGKVFDETTGDETTKFGLGKVIRGWTEGLMLMNAGAKYQFFIPANLAYGPGGYGGSIGPDETLIFELELVEIIAAPKRNILPLPKR